MSTEQELDFSARTNDAGTNELFVERWSPRAFEKTEIDSATLTRIIDAARWSPSCFNEQPWQFYTSGPESFEEYLSHLVEANQAWAKDASVIGYVVAQTTFARNGNPNDWARFDSGAAWMALSLQARMEGLYTHGMAGVNFESASEFLQLESGKQEVVMAFTIGKLAKLDDLSDEAREKEKPNNRKDLSAIWFPSK